MDYGVMSSSDHVVSPLDVLDGFFGGTPDAQAVGALTLAEIDELGELVQQSAEASARTRVAPEGVGELVYPGGWLASGWGEQLFRVELNCALLYESRLLVHDPLAEYFFSAFGTLPKMRSLKAEGMTIYAGPDVWADYGRRVHRGDNIDGIRSDLVRILTFLLDVEPLLRSGIIVMRSQWPTIRHSQSRLMRSAKQDMASMKMIAAASEETFEGGLLPRWDNLRGYQVEPSTGLLDPQDPAQWQPQFFYLAKTLAIADAAGAVYAPASADELRLLVAKTNSVAHSSGAKPTQPVLQEVLKVLVPDLTIPAAAAVKIRDSEEAFEAWRRSLRDIQRDAASVVDPVELKELVEDRIQPQVEAVTKAVGSSAVLSKAAGPALQAAVVGTVSNLATGLSLPQSAAAAGITGVAGWIWDAYRARRPDGSHAVVAALLRAHS